MEKQAMSFIEFQGNVLNAERIDRAYRSGAKVYVATREEDLTFRFQTEGLAEGALEELAFLLSKQDSPGAIAREVAQQLKPQLENIMAKLSTLAETLAGIKKDQDEANAELRDKIDTLTKRIADLEASLGDVDLPADAEANLEAVKSGAKALADIIPNAPTP